MLPLNAKATRLFIAAALVLSALFAAAVPCHGAYRDEEVARKLEAGDAFIKQGSYQEALREYRDAYELDKENPDCSYKMGVACYFLKDYDKATEHYKTAIRLKPDHFKALNNLALICQEQEEYAEATILYERAIQASPGYRLARYNLGVVLYRRDRMEQAEAAARELIRLFPDYDSAYSLMGLILENGERYDEADRMYRKALSLDKNNEDATEGIKRLQACLIVTPAQKDELSKARQIVPFRLPPEFCFQKVMDLDSGTRAIHIRFKTDQDMYLVKFAKDETLAGISTTSLFDKPVPQVEKFLQDMNISDVTLVKTKDFKALSDPASQGSPGSATRGSFQYATFDCTAAGSQVRGMLAVLGENPGGSPYLFLATGRDRNFTPGAAIRLILNTGNRKEGE